VDQVAFPVEVASVIKSHFAMTRPALSLIVAPRQNNVLKFAALSSQSSLSPSQPQTGFGFKVAGLLAAASALLVPGFATAQEAGQGDQNPFINEAQIQQVNHASDLPFLNRDLKQPVVDLLNHPLLKPETKAQLNQLLNDLNNSGKAQMALVMIPDTANRELNTLATDLFNQIGIGDAGQNNGLLFLVNANAARENRDHGKMYIMPGTALQYQFANGEAARIIRDIGIPHLNNNDPDAAVKAVTEHLINKLHGQRPSQAPRAAHFRWQEEAPQVNPWEKPTASDVLIVLSIIAALIILAIILEKLGISSSSGGSYSGGSYSGGSSGGSWSRGSSGSSRSSSPSSSSYGGGVSNGGGGGGD
jgi:uncharacterized protein